MISVGINLVTHDQSVAVVIDGKLAVATEVERFSRIKHNYVHGKRKGICYNPITGALTPCSKPLITPLVETPEQAIVSFALGGFDALWMDGYLITKK